MRPYKEAFARRLLIYGHFYGHFFYQSFYETPVYDVISLASPRRL